MAKTGFVYHKDYLDHVPSQGHPESPQRLEKIVSHLQNSGTMAKLIQITPKKAEYKYVEEIHSTQYIVRLQDASEKCMRYLDGRDTEISMLSFEVALLAAGGAIEAVRAVCEGEVNNAFCALRPPGHHATRHKAMGFCLFNNIAIAARYLQLEQDIKRVAIIDWDVHHGNGTQDAFYDDNTVFYFSVHQFPHYPNTGVRDEKGSGKGYGYTLNVPLPAGSNDTDYVTVFKEILAPAMEEFRPHFVLLSVGFDPHFEDPLGGMAVTDRGFQLMTESVINLAKKYCEGRIVSMLEGGYNLGVMARCVDSHIQSLLRA